MLIDLVTFTTFPWSTHITIPAIPHLGVLLRDHLVGGGLPRLDLAKNLASMLGFLGPTVDSHGNFMLSWC